MVEARAELHLRSVALQPVEDTDALQERNIPRQQRLADMKAGKSLALEEDHPIPLSRQKRRESGSGRAAAADNGIDSVGYQKRRVLHCVLRGARSDAPHDRRVERRFKTMLYQSGSCCKCTDTKGCA